MPATWGTVAGDGMANNILIYEHPPTKFETFPNNRINGVLTPVTAVTHFSRIFLEQGQPITNIGTWIGSTGATTPTSSWFGISVHPQFPDIATTIGGGGAKWVYSCVRNSTITVTIATGTFPLSLQGRLITGTGITGGTWVRSQTTTTLTLSQTATASGTSNLTVGQFAANKTNIAFTTNGATAAIAANSEYVRPISGGTPIITPAAGLYMLCFCFAAATMPTVCSEMHNQTGVPAQVFAANPTMMQSHVSGTTNNTAPGVNPPSGGTSADTLIRPYLFVT